MSIPPELRVLCFQLSSLPTVELPRHIPTLLQYVQCCHTSLSSTTSNTTKADSSSAFVLLHKLKTQLSALLNGRTSEARFTAAVLIKAVVEVGGWEVLQSSEPWVRGLLSVLGKPDHPVVKEICILSLTKIYLMTHQYQTLVREITTPTLPAYVTSCVNLLSFKATSKPINAPSSLTESIFHSFAMLIPRHPSIFRPFASQIRLVTRGYLAPTFQEQSFITSGLKGAARQLFITLYQTAAKNSGGEEWSRAVRDLVRDVHVTADIVFRAVIEDWESNSGYTGEPVDINNKPNDGGKISGDLPGWIGIDAGADRLIGLLELLTDHFRVDTSVLVTISITSILDVYTRMLSIALPSVTGNASVDRSIRLHPAIGKEERDELWTRLGCVYTAALKLMDAVAERLRESFIPIAQACLDQLTWAFPHGKRDEGFRLISYDVTTKILLCIGNSLERSQVVKAAIIIRSCCQDLCPGEETRSGLVAEAASSKSAFGPRNVSSDNADSYLRSLGGKATGLRIQNSALQASASNLLPLLISQIPQKHLDISLRSLIERTAILSRNKAAMLASILHPFVSKNGRTMASILPHLTSAFQSEEVMEILLRPRMPLLPTIDTRGTSEIPTNEESRKEDMDILFEAVSKEPISNTSAVDSLQTASNHSLDEIRATRDKVKLTPQPTFETHDTPFPTTISFTSKLVPTRDTIQPLASSQVEADIDMTAEDTSEDESVHLTMQLDTESEGEE